MQHDGVSLSSNFIKKKYEKVEVIISNCLKNIRSIEDAFAQLALPISLDQKQMMKKIEIA